MNEWLPKESLQMTQTLNIDFTIIIYVHRFTTELCIYSVANVIEILFF